jgi:Tfp pilus assembly protein PilF
MMESTNRDIVNAACWRLRGEAILASVILLAALILGGCASTNVAVDIEMPVTESRAKRDLGIDYLASGRTAMAIRELSTSLEMDPSDPQTHLWIGEAYRRKGQTARSESFLLEAIEIADAIDDATTSHAARLNLSALLSQMGRYEDSLTHCEALANDPTFSTPWRPLSNCGWALMKLGRLEEARTHFESSLEYFPRFGPALMNLSILEAKHGHRLKAIKLLEKALKSGRLTASGHAEANYRLGELYVALGRRDAAVDYFKTSARIAPDADWGSQSQAYLDLLR